MSERPTGKWLIRIGRGAFAVGVFAALLVSFLPVLDRYYALGEIVIILGIVTATLGAIAWMIGYLIFAISFIPGRGD